MHYSNLVIIERPEEDTPEAIEAAVKRAMGAPEDEGGFWDWYQIGGRWTGTLDGYDPETDPANLEHCELCDGTGDRKDLTPPEWKEECGGCNGCHGKGKRVKWPTSWADHPGDVAPIESLTEEAYGKFFRVVTPFAGVHGGEDYLPWKELHEMFPKKERPPLAWLKEHYAGHLIVVVDNHQ